MPKIDIAEVVVKEYEEKEVLDYLRDITFRAAKVLADEPAKDMSYAAGAALTDLNLAIGILRALRKKKYGDPSIGI